MSKSALMGTDCLNRMIAATEKFTKQNDNSRMHLCRIKLDLSTDGTAKATAIDGHRMSIEHGMCADCAEDFTVYVKAGTRLPKKGQVAITLTDDGECMMRCLDSIVGFKQPDGAYPNVEQILDGVSGEAQYVIAFNPDYLLSALQSAKISNGGVFRDPVKMEFRDPAQPIVLRTGEGGKNIKLVLPIRTFKGDT